MFFWMLGCSIIYNKVAALENGIYRFTVLAVWNLYQRKQAKEKTQHFVKHEKAKKYRTAWKLYGNIHHLGYQPFLQVQSHVPPTERFAGVHLPGANSSMGNAILRNASQGEPVSVTQHSLSGTLNSTALTRYCSGRSMRMTEKNPRDTAR